MRAVRFHRHGSVRVLAVEEVPVPEPGEGEAVIRVRACGLNRVDILARNGETPAPITLPHTLGSEVAGEVHAVGDGVTGLAEGQAVLVNPALSCGSCDRCRSGRDNVCRTGRVYGVQTDGGYADYAVAQASALVPLPSGVSFETAASVAVTGSTAWHMLMTRGGLRKGETALIVAAGSGIGVMAVQIAKAAGARVLATAGSDAKLAAAARLGADDVIDHRDPNWRRVARRLTGGEGADLVFEHVGAATWDNSLSSLRAGGRLVTCGGHSGFTVKINLWSLFAKEHTLIGSFAGTSQDLLQVLSLVAQGTARPIVHALLPLDQAARGQLMLEHREAFGKVLLLP